MKKIIKISKPNTEQEVKLSQFQKVLERQQSLNVIKWAAKEKELPQEKHEVLKSKVIQITKDPAKQKAAPQQQQVHDETLKISKSSLQAKQQGQPTFPEKKSIVIKESRPALEEKRIPNPQPKIQKIEITKSNKSLSECLSSQIKACLLNQEKQVEEIQDTVIIDLEESEDEAKGMVKSENSAKSPFKQKRPVEGQKKKIKIVQRNQSRTVPQEQTDTALVNDHNKSTPKKHTISPEKPSSSPVPSQLLVQQSPNQIAEKDQHAKEQSETKPVKKIICKNKTSLKVTAVKTEPLTQNQSILQKISSLKSSYENKFKGNSEQQSQIKLPITVQELDDSSKGTEKANDGSTDIDQKKIIQPLASIVKHLKDDEKDSQEAYVSFLERAFYETQEKLGQQKKHEAIKDRVQVNKEKLDDEDSIKEGVLGSKRRFLEAEKYVNIASIPEQKCIQTSEGNLSKNKSDEKFLDQQGMELEKLDKRKNESQRKESKNSSILIEEDRQTELIEVSEVTSLVEQQQEKKAAQEEELFGKGEKLSRQKNSSILEISEQSSSKEKELGKGNVQSNQENNIHDQSLEEGDKSTKSIGKPSKVSNSQPLEIDIEQIQNSEKDVTKDQSDQSDKAQGDQQENNLSPSNHKKITELLVDSIDLSTPTKESKTLEETAQLNEKPKSKKIDLMTYYEESDSKDKDTAQTSASRQNSDDKSYEHYWPYQSQNAHQIHSDVHKFIADVHSPTETNPLQHQHHEDSFYHEKNSNENADNYDIDYDPMEQEIYYVSKAQQLHALMQEQEEAQVRKGMGLFPRNLEVIHERVGEESESEKSQKQGKISPEEKSNDNSSNGSLSNSDEKHPLKELSQNRSTHRSTHTSFQKIITTVDLEDDQKPKQDAHEIDLEYETYLQALLKGKKQTEQNEKNQKESNLQVEEKQTCIDIEYEGDIVSNHSQAYGSIGRIQQQALRDTLE